jgi:polysaccharide pyruvyl transferase WcaK-like protein
MVIGVLDHMGYGNLGDAATQDVAIANIRKRLPQASVVGFSFIPYDTTERHGIPCYPIHWWYPAPPTLGEPNTQPARDVSSLKSVLKRVSLIYSPAKALCDLTREIRFWVRSYQTIKELDLLIISGGGQLSDLWRGPWSHPYTILKFSILTKIAGKKLFFLNVGAGPLNHPLSKLFAKFAVQLGDYRSFRDGESEQLIRSLGVKGKTHVAPDMAYGLEVEEFLKKRPSASSPVVGINPIGFCDPRVWVRKDQALYDQYLGKIILFVLWLLKQGYNVRMFTTETSVDKYALEDLRARLRERLAPELLSGIFQVPSKNVRDVLQEISEFDFVVTSKYHGIVFSQVLGKPVISLSYHRKMDFAMRAAGKERFCADIEGFDLDWLINAFLGLKESGGRNSQSAALVAKCAALLSQQFDDLFLPHKVATAASSPAVAVNS